MILKDSVKAGEKMIEIGTHRLYESSTLPNTPPRTTHTRIQENKIALLPNSISQQVLLNKPITKSSCSRLSKPSLRFGESEGERNDESKAYITKRFKVYREQYDFLWSICQNCNRATFKLLAHLVASTVLLYQKREEETRIRIPMCIIKEKIGKDASPMHLIGLDIIGYQRHQRPDLEKQIRGRTRRYWVQTWVMKKWFEVGRSLFESGEFVNAPRVNLMTGKPVLRDPKSKLTQGESRNQEPIEAVEAIKEVGRNGLLFNKKNGDDWLKQDWREVQELKEEADLIEDRDGWNSRTYEDAIIEFESREQRWWGALSLYELTFDRKSTRHIEGDIWRYVPAYELNESGRASEKEGGLQNIPGEMKQAIYRGIENFHNWDLSSSHPNAFRLLVEDRGIDVTWLAEVLDTPNYKEVYAAQVELDPKTWKAILLAIINGFDLPERAYQPHKKEKALTTLWKAVGKDLNQLQGVLNRLRGQFDPLYKIRVKWRDDLLDKYVPSNSLRAIRNGREFLPNAAGKMLYIDELPKGRVQRAKKITYFLLAGIETKYLNTLTMIGAKHDSEFKVQSWEYDGVLTIGCISEDAKHQAAIQSGFKYANLIEKSFDGSPIKNLCPANDSLAA